MVILRESDEVKRGWGRQFNVDTWCADNLINLVTKCGMWPVHTLQYLRRWTIHFNSHTTLRTQHNMITLAQSSPANQLILYRVCTCTVSLSAYKYFSNWVWTKHTHTNPQLAGCSPPQYSSTEKLNNEASPKGTPPHTILLRPYYSLFPHGLSMSTDLTAPCAPTDTLFWSSQT